MASYYGVDPELTKMMMGANIDGLTSQAIRNSMFTPAPIRPLADFLDPGLSLKGRLEEPFGTQATIENMLQGALSDRPVRPNVAPMPRPVPPQMGMPNPANFPFAYSRNTPQRPPGLGPEIVTAPGTDVNASPVNEGLQQAEISQQPQMRQFMPAEQQGSQMDPRRNIKQGTDAGFGEGAPTDPVQQMGNAQQEQQQGSDAWKWGLLAAGLGILANNKGNYGAAGPAIGAGGMQGLNTFLGLKQQETQEAMRKQQMEQNKQYQDRSIGVQERQFGIQQQKLQEEQARFSRQQDIALALAGDDPQRMKIALANPEKFIEFSLAQQKTDYKERSIRSGDTAKDEYSTDGGKTWQPIPGGGQYSMKARAGGTDIGLKVDTKQGEAFTKPIADQVDASYTKAQSAVTTQQTLNNLRTRLEDPRVISGFAANQRIALAQLGQLLGGSGEELAATREVIQNLAELTLQSRGMLKGQGQVTEFEQKTLTKARSGEIDFTLPELKALVNVLTRFNKAQYDAHSSVMRRLSGVGGADNAMQFYQPDAFPDYAPQKDSGAKDPWE